MTTAVVESRTSLTTGLGAPGVVLVILCMMVLPLPAMGLDLLFTFNISLSLVILLATIYSSRPLEFAAFPTVLLVATLMRLALNVASTRVVLMEGHTGTAAAGRVIEAFGAFVIGGSYAVGVVVFAILVIINFVVVTKGASRVSEVSARFTLDALPGKQMAVDADLNSGLITQEEAKQRRAEVSEEADFYGAMDGAGKFVRGDAIAGLLILLINIFGGLIIGTTEHGLSFSLAVENYALLTVGDGLVAQIPSLLLSTAAAIMVTRVSAAKDMSEQIVRELFHNPRSLGVTAGVVGTLGLIPGMPNFAFLTIAGIAGIGAYLSDQKARASRARHEAPQTSPVPELTEVGWDDVAAVDPLGLEVGYRLIPLVDRDQKGDLLGRIKGVRKKLSQEFGFLVPPVHIRDNLELGASAYRLSMLGVMVGEGELMPDRELAINPGEVFGELDGESAQDPVFGLQAIWIDPGQKSRAQTLGYTVVDCSTVVATHLSQVLNDQAHRLLGHQEAQHLLDRLAQTHGQLVEELVPKLLSLGTVVQVLQSLLRERIPVRDIRSIVEALAEAGTKTQDVEHLVSAVRRRIGRFIVQTVFGPRTELPVVTLHPNLDQIVQQTAHGADQGAVQGSNGQPLVLEPGLVDAMDRSLNEIMQEREVVGEPCALLVPDAVRMRMSNLLRPSRTNLHVLGFGEIPDHCNLRLVGSVGAPVKNLS